MYTQQLLLYKKLNVLPLFTTTLLFTDHLRHSSSYVIDQSERLIHLTAEFEFAPVFCQSNKGRTVTNKRDVQVYVQGIESVPLTLNCKAQTDTTRKVTYGPSAAFCTNWLLYVILLKRRIFPVLWWIFSGDNTSLFRGKFLESLFHYSLYNIKQCSAQICYFSSRAKHTS